MTLRIIGGLYKGHKLKAPPTKSTRPTQNMVREAVFNICQTQIVDATFLDLFAGSGCMGLEALSRGAKSATFVEKNRLAIQAIEANVEHLHVQEKTKLYKMTVSKAIEQLAEQDTTFDIIYIDPPYDTPFDLTDIQTLTHIKTTIFLEERINTPAKEYPGFFCQKSKTFGSTSLRIFEISPSI